MSGAGFRASIPSSVRRTIQNIKEITGNHSEEDIYAMLKECSMDPNETTQKLLLQDTFHEVKRKKDRRKENLNNRESVEPRWRHGTQGRGARGGRGNFSPHNVSHDAAGSKNSGTGKDSGTHQATEKVVPPLSASQETISKEKSSGTSSVPINANGQTSVTSGTTSGASPSPLSAGTGDRLGSSSCDVNNLNSALPSDSSNKVAAVASGSGSMLSSSNHPASSSAAHFSSSDPVLVPSDDLWFPGAVGAIRREVGNLHPPGELSAVNSAENKLTAG
ncbi:GBF-interacting protein 1 [Glycine soja]